MSCLVGININRRYVDGVDMMRNPLNDIFGRSKWKAKMSNDAKFELKSSPLLTQSEAKNHILNIANADYGNIYLKTDIKHIWRVKK